MNYALAGAFAGDFRKDYQSIATSMNFSLHLLRPLKGGAPSLIIVFAIGIAIAESAGLLGLALGLILLSWYSKYAFILFDHVVSGVQEPPALDIQMVNPADEQRPLAMLCILAGMYWACHAVSGYVGVWAGRVATGLLLFCLPACAAVLGLESDVFKALNPASWFRIVSGLRGLYLVLIGLIAVYVFVIIGITRLDLWRPVQLALLLFSGLSIFSLLAGFLYERRDEVGIDVVHSPEKTEARKVAVDTTAAAKLVDTAYGQMRASQHVEAWKTLMDWLDSRGHDLKDYEWLSSRIDAWSDQRYLDRIAEEYVDRLMAANRNSVALEVAGRALKRNPQFRPKSARATLRLAHIAASGGASRIARALLEDFAKRFQGSPETGAAEILARRLA